MWKREYVGFPDENSGGDKNIIPQRNILFIDHETLFYEIISTYAVKLCETVKTERQIRQLYFQLISQKSQSTTNQMLQKLKHPGTSTP